MKLDKAICKRCINKSEDRWKWNEWVDHRWNKGYVLCPNKFIRTYTDEIPDKCPYKLEHIVSYNAK